MSLEEDLSKLEGKVESFSIAGAAGNFRTGFTIGADARGSGSGVQQRPSSGGTPEERLTTLEKMFHGLRIMGGEGVNVHGGMQHGYAVEVKPRAADSGTGGPGPTPTGACCMLDNSCNILTSDDCATMGGTYKGDGVSCEGACGTGACCADGGDCSLNTEADCVGVYAGDGTDCDPNLCTVTHFNITGVTSCCMNSGGFSYDLAATFNGDFGGDPMTGPNEWFFSGPSTGQQYTGSDCNPDNFVGSFDIDTHFELSKSGSLWTFSWYFIIDGVHFPIFYATSTTMDFINTIADCGGGSNGAFGGSVTSFSFT